MKKIVIGASILILSISSLGFVSANHHGEAMNSDSHNMMEIHGEYGMFTDMVRDNLTETEKTELNSLIEKHNTGMKKVKAIVGKVKSGDLDSFEEFAKIAPKRKSMIGKLKVFMKDNTVFDSMARKHGNKLISNLFTKEAVTSKYKIILEKKYKSKIEKLYSIKGSEFEILVHNAIHKNIDSKNIKNISALIAIDLIIQDIKAEKEIGSIMKEEFGGFTKFAKKI
ncbi:MAG: hypothetical protein Q9M97_09580 [Candidatus Gracilibacteria bacterium]|nr:hypothetical protein [Candidatus Gracilibacteria bacterium]